MDEQQITWGWAFRIIWGAIWRWIVASAVAISGQALIVVLIARMGGPNWRHDPVMPGIVIILWLLALVWALGAALRARHGGYRLILVSGTDRLDVFN